MREEILCVNTMYMGWAMRWWISSFGLTRRFLGDGD